MGKTVDETTVEQMLLLWGAVQRARLIGGPDCSPSASDLKSIWESSTGGGTYLPSQTTFSNVLLQSAEIDGWMKSTPHLVRDLFWKEYVIGVEEKEIMVQQSVGDQVIDFPKTDVDGDTMYRIVKTFNPSIEEIPEYAQTTCDKYGIHKGVFLKFILRTYKRRLANSKGWKS